MAYTAPAEAASRGIERGVGIIQGLTNLQRQGAADRRAEETHNLQMQEGAQRIAASQSAQARQDDADLLRLSEQEGSNIQAEHDATIQRYGGWQNVPQEEASRLGKRYGQWRDNRDQLFEKARTRINGWVDDGRKTARDLANGRSVPGDALYRSVAVNTGMNPTDFLDMPDGTPSPVRQAIDSAKRAGETGNWQEMVPAANVLLKGELRQGVGTLGRDGTPITGKEIVGFVPVPNMGEGAPQGDLVYPVLRVRTKGHPDGYTAPVTQDRSSDPNDPPQPVSVSKLVSRMGEVETLANSLNHPQTAAQLRAADKKVGDETQANLDLFSQMPNGKRKVKTEQVQQGNQVTHIVQDEGTGTEISREVFPKGIDPAVEQRLETMEKVAGIRADALRANNENTNATRRDIAANSEVGKTTRTNIVEAGKTSRVGTTEAGKTARAGAGGAGGKLTNAQQDKMVEAEASQYGAYRIKGEWKQWSGPGEPGKGQGYWKDATPETLQKVAEIKGKVASRASPSAPAAGINPTGAKVGGAPYAEGTQLVGPDGKKYVVQGGKPVLSE